MCYEMAIWLNDYDTSYIFRYRKIAADNCLDDGKVDAQYETKKTICPKLPPEGIHISTSTTLAVRTGKKVKFHLTQEKVRTLIIY